MRAVPQLASAILVLLGGFVSARALEWKADTQTVTTAPFQSELVVVFEFTNRSAKPVQIHEIETTCSCLRADSDLKTYPPGASGKITANFAVGDRGGLYERGITIITDEPNSPARLLLRVEVPDVATVTPRSVNWRIGEPLAEKLVQLTCAPGVEIEFSRTQATSEGFEVKLDPVESGKHYRLHLTPRHADRPDSAAIRIYGRDKSGHDVVLSAYASIQ